MLPDEQKDTYKELAIPLPDYPKWEAMNVAKKSKVIETLRETEEEIIKACPAVKKHVDIALRRDRMSSRRSEGMAIMEIRGALWQAYYGKPERCLVER